MLDNKIDWKHIPFKPEEFKRLLDGAFNTGALAGYVAGLLTLPAVILALMAALKVWEWCCG